MQGKSHHQSGDKVSPEVLAAILQAIQNIRYGSIEIVNIHPRTDRTTGVLH